MARQALPINSRFEANSGFTDSGIFVEVRNGIAFIRVNAIRQRANQPVIAPGGAVSISQLPANIRPATRIMGSLNFVHADLRLIIETSGNMTIRFDTQGEVRQTSFHGTLSFPIA